MLSTWETFARKRYEKGREDERKEQAKRIAELEEDREEDRKEREALKKRNAELEEALTERG